MKFALPFVCLLLAAPVASADVVDSTVGGFTVKVTVDVAAPSARVYQALVERISLWWDPVHSFSGNAANLSIDARPGGCFCERLPCWRRRAAPAAVIHADPGKLLRMSGGLGPLQDLAVTGVLSWKLTEAGGKTAIDVTYKVGGYAPGGGVGALAAPVDAVLSAQVSRLAQFVSTH